MIDTKSFYVKVPNDYILSQNLNDKEFMVYILICRTLNEAKGCAFIQIQYLMHLMCCRPDRSDIASDLISSLHSLQDKHMVSGIYDLFFNPITRFGKSDSVIVEVPIVDRNYVPIYDNDVDKIMRYSKNTNINKYKLIRYFIAIKRVCNYVNDKTNIQYHIGYLTQSQCQNIIENYQSITRYNNILHDLGLICFNNNWCQPGGRYIKTYFNDTNDQDRIDQYCELVAAQEGMIPTDKVKSNKRRSVAQKGD